MADHSSLITFSTTLSVAEVMDRIEKILREKNITIFARISHSEAARNAGLTMQDEELIIFGNPKVGTALMIESPAIGIELPLRIIAWKKNQETIVGFQDTDKLVSEYQIETSTDTIRQFKKILTTLVETAIK
jgi:uncharacterized protein (DUF302 family)